MFPGLQIAMNDPLTVGRVERPSDSDRDAHRFFE
jgi:hypothetical protein